jgi:hypothetical protein
MNPYADKSTMTAEVYAGVHDVVVEILEPWPVRRLVSISRLIASVGRWIH